MHHRCCAALVLLVSVVVSVSASPSLFVDEPLLHQAFQQQQHQHRSRSPTFSRLQSDFILVNATTDDQKSSMTTSSVLLNGHNISMYVAISSDPVNNFRFFPAAHATRHHLIVPSASSHHNNGNSYPVGFDHSHSRYVPFQHVLHSHTSKSPRANDQCHGVASTSTTARAHSCYVGINAGFFDISKSECLGTVVVDGHVVHRNSQDGGSASSTARRIYFGVSARAHYFIGYVDDDSLVVGVNDTLPLNGTAIDGGMVTLVQGYGWLIRNGEVNVDASVTAEQIPSDFVEVAAPRTAIGHDAEGRLLVAEIDGEEDIKAGPNLYEWASLLQQAGFVNAVNLDGGGSATVVVNGKVVDRPTCVDTPLICERPVTTIACLLE